MTNRAHRTLAIALALTLAGSACALAAGPLNGKSYQAGAPSWGVSGEGHRIRTHASGDLVLRVASNGRTVTVRFSGSSYPVLYCRTNERLYSQSTKPASISSSGRFRATVGEKFTRGPGLPAVVQVVSGQFKGHMVYGLIRTQVPECGGVSSFAASAR